MEIDRSWPTEAVEAELVDDADLLLDEDEHVRNESEEWGGITTFSRLFRNESLSRLYISSQYVSLGAASKP